MNVIHQKEKNRFVLQINNQLAKVDYVIKDKKMYLTHSEVPIALRGKGIGKELVLQTFTLLTKEGYQAVAVCSYIKAIAQRSPEWKNIIL